MSEITFVEDGCVTTAAGFRAAGIHCGYRAEPGRLDLALVEAADVCTAAGVFTTNVFCSAPVIVSRENLDGCGYGSARAVVINSGIANAATGSVGLDRAREQATITADGIGCAAQDVLVASTGVIGQHLDLQPLRDSIDALHNQASDSAQGGHDAARAIMTTDTVPKECAVTYEDENGVRITVGGMVKGAGMIMPNMATMISVLTTDARIAGGALHEALRYCVDRSFNKITVDSDTSTNDTCVILASGASGCDCIESGTPEFDAFRKALLEVCQNLARKMAADGEGATRLVTVHVTGAASDDDADKAARAIANSPLVKTAIYGHDANWGRIAAAAGKSGAVFDQERVDIDIMGLPVCRSGLTVEFDEEEALRRFEEPEIAIEVNLGAGTAETMMWTCDFSHDYVTINGDYRS